MFHMRSLATRRGTAYTSAYASIHGWLCVTGYDKVRDAEREFHNGHPV